ncbi:MAG: hypothetical protein M1600_02275 [Firmicutes bacterium]|nr:hypothetical protein [Bacillota bacterium]
MRTRTLMHRLAMIAGITLSLGIIDLPKGLSHATTGQSVSQQQQQRVQLYVNPAKDNTNIASDHPIGVVSLTPTKPSRIQGPAPFGFVQPAITQTTAWFWGRYPGSSIQDLSSGIIVVSGSVPNAPTKGEIGVWVTNMSPAPAWQGQFVAPGRTGPISIETFQGQVARWTSPSGEQGTFNIASHLWSISRM